MQATKEQSELDVLVVGAGFSGVYHLHNLRKLGYSVKVFEAGGDLGGVWYWNCYPGARVDSEVPTYEFSIEELWRDWCWKERFPGREELCAYFQYVDRKLDLKRDISFNTRVVAAHYESDEDRWRIAADNGMVVCARFLVLCTGFAAKIHIPDFKGLDTFQGIRHHVANWPQEGVDMHGMRVGVVGTGAAGVQVIQEIAPEVAHLTVFQRTPSITLPLNQFKVDDAMHKRMRELSPLIYRRRKQTPFGHNMDVYPQETLSASPEQRLLKFEELWARGGLNFVAENYIDVMVNQEANNELYAFWREKVRAKLNDPENQEKLAPTIPPYPIGAKRPIMVEGYYEAFNQPNVDLVDLSQVSISEITPKGVVTSDGVERELDILVFASGFDSVTGGITQIDIRGADGTSIADKWAKGVYTNLGMTTANFPNMFFLYGPQGPTAFCNGPTCIEIQGDWIIGCIKYMMDNKLTRIEATREAEEEWRALVMSTAALTLLSKAKSWYNGANIPGKILEPLNFSGGVPFYDSICRKKAGNNYEGFTLASQNHASKTTSNSESENGTTGGKANCIDMEF